jgi:Holliday junction DNA helicase RuvA
MITRIAGKIRDKKDGEITVDVNGICYAVLVPPVVMKALETSGAASGAVDLITYHYLQIEPSRGMPVLIGFTNEIEKEFFEQFITVSGIGPKAACRAFTAPFSSIADAIDRGDTSFLKTLPGIGEQRAREIVAKLQGKVGKFGLIQDRFVASVARVKEDVKEEALNVLLQLQYKKREAEEMIAKAVSRNPQLDTCEDILNEVYKGALGHGKRT